MPVRAELLAVGDELLYGDILNGNAAQLGRQLADVGITVTHSGVVGDDIETIAEALRARDVESARNGGGLRSLLAGGSSAVLAGSPGAVAA